MKRYLEQDLITWMTSKQRSPLLLRGDRQVGKTYLVESFANQHFDKSITINFEKNPEYAECFSTFEVQEILQKISIYNGNTIQPGKTLLFLDEIQACPRAIQSLRYFKEDMPQLHVIAAGSLLEFALQEPGFKMPVGRVQYMYLKPLSFLEYLEAAQKDLWIEEIRKASVTKPIPDFLHQLLIKELKVYMTLGGMPAIVSQALSEPETGSFQQIQHNIIETYIDDFAKYAKIARQVHLKAAFDQLPNLIGKQTKYSSINPDVQSRFLKEAINCLELAGVVHKIYATSASVLMSQDILMVNRGEIAKQFISLSANLQTSRHSILGS